MHIARLEEQGACVFTLTWWNFASEMNISISINTQLFLDFCLLASQTKKAALVRVLLWCSFFYSISFLEQHGASVNKTQRESGQHDQSDTEEQAGRVCDTGEEVRAQASCVATKPNPIVKRLHSVQCPTDAERPVWAARPDILPVGPRLHHAGGDHEPHRGNAAVGRAAPNDQVDTGRTRPELSLFSSLLQTSYIHLCLGFLFQRIPAPLFVLEIWKACFTGLIESPEGTEELKWTAFTFLKVCFL